MSTASYRRHYFDEGDFPVKLHLYKSNSPAACLPNYHPEIEFQLFRRGKGQYFIRNANYELGTNSVIMAHKNEVHAYTPYQEPSPMVKLCLIFSPTILRGRPASISAMQRLRTVHHLVLSDKQAIVAEFLLNNIGDECSTKHLNWQISVADQIEAFLILLHRASEGQFDDRRYNDPVIQGVIKYLEDKFKESPSLAEVSDRFGMSQCSLSRKFKQYVGLGYKEYLIHRRIVEAQRMLEETELKVLAIAYEVGFESVSTFNRGFHMLTGITPADYRKLSRINKTAPSPQAHAQAVTLPDSQYSTTREDS